MIHSCMYSTGTEHACVCAIWVYMRMCVNMFVHMYVCICTCLCVCLCVCGYIYFLSYVYSCKCSLCAVYACACSFMYCMGIITYVRAHTGACMCAYVCVYMCRCVCVCTHIFLSPHNSIPVCAAWIQLLYALMEFIL